MLETGRYDGEFGVELGGKSDFNVAVAFIDRHLREGRAAKVAIRTASRVVTYGELHRNVNRSANALLSLGIARGDRVLLVVKDCPEFFYLFWGAIKAGIVPVPLNTLLRAGDYEYMIEDSRCAAIFWSPEYAREVCPAVHASRTPPKVAMPVEGENSFVSAMEKADDELSAVLASADDECFWLYSSGSTGRPKAAVHRQRDMMVTSQSYGVETLGAREDDVFFSAAKVFFAYGLGNGMPFPLWVGGTSILLETRPTPSATFEVISSFKPTLYFGVPTLYAAQLQALEKKAVDFSSIRACVSAGEALPADILRRWKEKTGTLILDGIGSTEALHMFISNRLDDCRPGSSGRPVKGYEARIVDESGAEVPPGGQGRLQIKGTSTAAYYRNNPEKTKSTMLGPWLDTGDTYYRDAEGYFYYCGRADDMLKVGGIWSSPFEIESALISHPAIVEVAVVGRADDNELIKPEAWIVLQDGCRPSSRLEEELIQHCKNNLAPYKFPRWFRFVDALPKTATGKIQRYKLKAAGSPHAYGALPNKE
jgi:benzoate-CoA ligase family protein